MVQHQMSYGVKRKQNGLEDPVFIRFCELKRAFQKKTQAKSRFVHACCIHSHIVYKASAGSGTL